MKPVFGGFETRFKFIKFGLWSPRRGFRSFPDSYGLTLLKFKCHLMYFRLTVQKEEVLMAGKGGNSLLEGALPDLVLEMGYHFTSRYTALLPGIPVYFQVYQYTSRYTTSLPGIPLYFRVYQYTYRLSLIHI